MGEIKAFGTQFAVREDASEEWRVVERDEVPPSVMASFEEEETARRERFRRPPRVAPVIVRSQRNIAIADALGLSADELADDLVLPHKNAGTKRRVTDEQFGRLMSDLGLDPDEARDRFAGRYWQAADPARDKTTAKAPGF